MVNRIKSPIRDLKQRLRKVLVRWREVILFSPPELVIREFKIAKTSPKSVFAFLYSLSRLFQLAYFVKCWRTLLRMKPCSEPPRQRNVLKKKTFIKKGDAWANSGRACVLSVLLTPLGEMISFMKYSLSRHRNMGLMIEKWALGNFQGWPKKDGIRISFDSVSNIHWSSKYVN